MQTLKDKIRDIPDFPQPGVVFRDITPLIRDHTALRTVTKYLIEPFVNDTVTVVAGMEARGFIFGTLAAWEMGCGFVPFRKPGKLPYATHTQQYDLEYGSASLEVHTDALTEDDHVLLVDDLIATGGTAAASCELIEKTGATIAGFAFVIELIGLSGRQPLSKYKVHSLIQY